MKKKITFTSHLTSTNVKFLRFKKSGEFLHMTTVNEINENIVHTVCNGTFIHEVQQSYKNIFKMF